MQLYKKVSNVLPGIATSPDYSLFSACYLNMQSLWAVAFCKHGSDGKYSM